MTHDSPRYSDPDYRPFGPHPLPADYEPEPSPMCQVCGDEEATTETEFNGKTVPSCAICASPENVQEQIDFQLWLMSFEPRDLRKLAAWSDELEAA